MKHENIPIKGIFKLQIYQADNLIENYEDSNLIVNGAKYQTARLVAGQGQERHIAKIAFGTNGKEPEPKNIIITNQFVKNINAFNYPDDGRVQFDWNLLISENNGMSIFEFGLLTADGMLFARKSRVNPIFKASDISLEGQWTIIFGE
jgi:hypothetical protein